MSTNIKIEVNETSLYTEIEGEGDPVVFIHGSNSDYRTWTSLRSTLSSTYRTICYSRRYHHPNEPIPPDTDYSMSQHLDDLEELIKEVADEPVHLIGHSYGAFLAMLLAIRSPELIRKMVLIEPPMVTLFISIPPKPSQILKLLFTRPRTAIALIRFATSGLNPATKAAEEGDLEKATEIFAQAILGEKTYNTLSEERLEQAMQNAFLMEFLGSGFLPVDPDDLQGIENPVLLVNGEDSPAFFHRIIDRIHDLVPDSRRIEVTQASHIVHEDNTQELGKAVLSFLDTL